MDITDLVYIDETGYHFADYPAFLAWIQGEYRAIYGADVYIEPDSQDGQFLAILAKAFYDTAALGASVYNSFSPVTAQGVGLARNVKINGLTKRTATFSTVDVLITGQAGTVLGVVGAPAVAIDTLEQKWDIPIGTTIPGPGTITVTATAQEEGAVNAAVNTVNRIFTPTRGWQSVNNAGAATPGVAVESDAELRARQEVSTANPSETVFDGTIGAVANLPGVTRVRGYENDTASTDANGIPEHSISVVVEGGDVQDICETIQLHKTPGCGTYGDTSMVVTDPRGIPALIAFERPVLVPIEVQVIISVNSGYTAAYADLIADAIAAAINAIGIGNDVLYTKLFIAAYLQGTQAFGTFDVVSVEISRDGDPVAAANVDIDWNEIASCTAATDVTVID
jgi:uncharacterized phage protein gp47/JayE